VTVPVGRRPRGEDDDGEDDVEGEAGEPATGPARRFGWRRAGKHAGVSTVVDEPEAEEAGDEAAVAAAPGEGRGRRPGRATLRLGLQVALGLTLAGLVYVAVTFVQVWDASRTDDVRRSDAIVVLGAAQYDCVPSPVLRSRLDHALELYQDGVAPRIVVTGGRQALDRCTEAKAGADYLRGEGVPDGDILLEVKGRNTWESIAASAQFLTDEGYTRVVLVTDDYHALRVRAIADELGLEPVVSPVGDNATFRELARETGAVAVGRVVGFRRLVQLDDRLVPDPGS
jgi:uncharacterized SAM-binding protein YcdF (DUF218 family)